jgi:myo-inositol-1(or 4)-monophosphatase
VLKEGEPLLGVIYDPLRDHMFMAEKGGGAKLNDNPIHVSPIASLDRAVVGLDWGHTNEVREHILTYLHRIVPRCGTLRVLGSAALAMAYVAAGWLDAYFQLGLKLWDVGAGMLIITEAGGRCSTLEGRPYHVNLPGCFATNNLIHEEMLTAMHGCDVH